MRLPLVNQWLQRTLHVLNYVHVLRFTYKQAITGTFGITLLANFLSLQLIYDKKPAQSFPKSKTPETFILKCKLKTPYHSLCQRLSRKVEIGTIKTYINDIGCP